jgi:DNA helicase II / ATP-dependent DNA helicase PcrA
MRANNALDFDDLLSMAVALLRTSADVRNRLRRKFRHVLCDEFQDTNNPQYELLKLLAGVEPKNAAPVELIGGRVLGPADLFVVGDPDQAIYGWRGADVGNMQTEFDLDFPEASTFFLRDNYRSSGGILGAAQSVIARNQDWDRLQLNAKLGMGVPIQVCQLDTNHDEAEHIGKEISCLINDHRVASEHIAVLLRTHAQGRLVEKELVARSIPYVLIGGLAFWRRLEIQDAMAYVRLAVTLDDGVALDRVINVPKRGLGPASVAKLTAAAAAVNLTPCQLLFGKQRDGVHVFPPLPDAKTLGVSAKAAAALEEFRAAVAEMRAVTSQEGLWRGLNVGLELVSVSLKAIRL